MHHFGGVYSAPQVVEGDCSWLPLPKNPTPILALSASNIVRSMDRGEPPVFSQVGAYGLMMGESQQVLGICSAYTQVKCKPG